MGGINGAEQNPREECKETDNKEIPIMTDSTIQNTDVQDKGLPTSDLDI